MMKQTKDLSMKMMMYPNLASLFPPQMAKRSLDEQQVRGDALIGMVSVIY